MNGEKLGHILIIEDNRDTQTLLKYLLGADYNLKIVGEFNQAIEIANEASFDLLLIDINLGEERTGVDLLNILRETDPYNDVPMVAITAYAM
nr:response regulator [Rhodothermaceae bacterium]